MVPTSIYLDTEYRPYYGTPRFSYTILADTMASESSPEIYTEKFTSRAVRRTSPNNVQSIKLFAAIIFIGAYGLVCHQIGASSRPIETAVHIQTLEYSYDAPEHSFEYQNEISPAPIRELDESQLPYKCGVVFFYHIPSTGGVSDPC
jgi:hypothetical protein